MKKIILLSIILLELTGCDSGHLTNRCIKEEKARNQTTFITYEIGFKNDVVDKIDITYDYQGSDVATIASIRDSVESFAHQLKPDYEILLNEDNHYKILYHVSKDSDEEIKKQFEFQEKRSKLVNNLKEQGFNCK